MRAIKSSRNRVDVMTALAAVGLIIVVFISGCKKENPVTPPETPPDLRKITLSEEGKSCTEIWLKINTDSIKLPTKILLNDKEIRLFSSDTTVYFDSLQVNNSYKYKAVLKEDTTIKSEEIKIQTLPPTSHNFSYKTWELGNMFGGMLYDVTIIDENNIWAVGEINQEDSTGNSVVYNAVHWDGKNWELQRIFFPTVCGQNSVTSFPSSAIFNLINNTIWMSSTGNKIAVLENNIQTNKYCLPTEASMSVTSIWGNNTGDDVYLVGRNGKIAKYDGTTWSSIESPTDLTLTDIYSRGNGEIYAAGVNSQELKGIVLKGNDAGEFTILAKGEHITESEMFRPNLYGSIGAVWVDENNTVYAGGHLLYRYKNSNWNYVTSLSKNYWGGDPAASYRGVISSIRGNSVNDYIIAGDRNTLKHFNGVDWEQLGLPYDVSSGIVWRDVEVKGNTAVAVGNKGNKAFIILLNR